MHGKIGANMHGKIGAKRPVFGTAQLLLKISPLLCEYIQNINQELM